LVHFSIPADKGLGQNRKDIHHEGHEGEKTAKIFFTMKDMKNMKKTFFNLCLSALNRVPILFFVCCVGSVFNIFL